MSSSIRDNYHHGKVGEFLRDKIAEGSNLSIVSAYFTIYAYQSLQSDLERIHRLQFLFGEPRFIKSLDPEKTEKKSFKIEDEDLVLSNRLQQKPLAKECAKWLKEKVDIRSIRQSNLLHGKMYHIHDGNRPHAIVGSSNFTTRGLGLAATPNIELNMVVDSDRDREDLKGWFDRIWNDDELVADVKAEVLKYLTKLYEDHPPEFIYFKTLFHIFEQYLSDQAEDTKLFDRTEIVDTDVWNVLYEFQKDGAKAAIHKINAHNGCILADSVGLGKTYTALAVIKYYELRNLRVLVLCPKRLRENWTVYQVQNNSPLNPFLNDRFGYTVLSHTDLSRERGKVGDIDLADLNWGNYDLVVIDESHNFRNNAKGKTDDEGNVVKKSRYEKLMQDIIQAGVKTKVLMLSATPVNTDLKDLRNQLRFVSEGRDNEFAESFGINSLQNTLAAAQRTFTEWASKKGDKKDTRELHSKLSGDFFKLLDSLTIARSRKHIQRHYANYLQEFGNFPNRKKPVSLSSNIDLATDPKAKFPSYDTLNSEISQYALSLFNPTKYVLPEHRKLYDQNTKHNFSQTKREYYLIGMMKVNFLKRLESSVHSFGITMERTVGKIEKLEKELQSFQAKKGGGILAEQRADKDEEDEDVKEALEVGEKITIPYANLDIDRWLQDLQRDREQLAKLRLDAEAVTPERDAKLADLCKIIERKIKSPPTNAHGEPNRKVVVFCAFSDTVRYLYDNLWEWATETLGVNIAMVSGAGNETTFGGKQFNDILANFSPLAKERSKMAKMPQNGEIDILIATDCISEGQNLQDCDYLVNYDIHWNPVRIIQRFGRIDRIGSLNSEIQLVNFWPTDNLEKYIDLKNRVEARMALADIAATAEDNILRDGDEGTLKIGDKGRQGDATGMDVDEQEDQMQLDLHYRDKQLIRMKEEVLDLEEFNETVSLSEFTLDDFRMDLAAYLEANREKLEEAPLGLYGVAPPDAEYASIQPGAIFCLKQNRAAEGNEKINALNPYFLVYVYDNGEVRYNFTHPKHVLEVFKEVCYGKDKPYRKLCELFDERTKDGEDMRHYSKLLEGAVQAIVRQFASKNSSNLFTGRGGRLTDASKRVKDSSDFELITWLVIMNEDTNDG